MSDIKTKEAEHPTITKAEEERINKTLTIAGFGLLGLITTTIFIAMDGLWMSSLTCYVLISSVVLVALKAVSEPEDFEVVATVALITIGGPAGVLLLGKFAKYIYNSANKWDFPIF